MLGEINPCSIEPSFIIFWNHETAMTNLSEKFMLKINLTTEVDSSDSKWQIDHNNGVTEYEIAVIAVNVTYDKYEPTDVIETIFQDVNITWSGNQEM